MGLKDLFTSSEEDSGNRPESYYKTKLSPLRYQLRSLLLPFVLQETPILFNNFQKPLRHPILDLYFAWTANLASHTFYVIMLPLPFWFGWVEITRDLVWVLGLGIYVSGTCKDYFCLPRPKSPPLHRITMSGYTAKEYGFPSSHSANATSVTLVCFYYYLTKFENNSLVTFGVLIYFFSLMFGRIYCGMHGFIDILTGCLIGIGCFILRLLMSPFWDSLILNSNYSNQLIPLSIILSIFIMIYFHSQPIDDCPCFDDSVAFVGVLMGLELTCYYMSKTSSNYSQIVDLNLGITSTITLPYSYKYFGIFKTLLRVVIGVTLVVIWKSLSKKIILITLKNVYSFLNIDKNKPNLNKKIDKEIADLPNFIDSIVTKPQIVDTKGDNPPPPKGSVFKKRYDVEIITRLMVYAGIPFMAIYGFAIATRFVGLEYVPGV